MRGLYYVNEQLGTTVKALLGALMEDVQDKNCVLQAEFSLGLEVLEESVEVVENVPKPVQ